MGKADRSGANERIPSVNPPMRPRAAGGWAASCLCAIVLLLSVAATNPRVEMGMNDDWSYIYSAMVLAKTGHLVYNGWATTMLGWQLYLGALFIKLFGFSFTITRVSIFPIALATVLLMHRLLLRFGVSLWNATVGTLVLTLSPLYLPLSASFMSDVPAFFCLLLCLYCCLRAMQAETGIAVLAWLVVATVTNVLDGTVRQIVWLGALVMVPATVWYLRRRPLVLLTGAVLWAASLVAVFVCMHWLKQQPYLSIELTMPIGINAGGLLHVVKGFVRSAFTTTVLLAPIFTAFAVKYPCENRTAWRTLLLTVGLFAVIIGFLSITHSHLHWLTLLLGNYVTAKGVLDIPPQLGSAADLIPNWLGAAIAFLVFSSLAMLAGWIYFVPGKRSNLSTLWANPLLWLMGPFSVVYLGLILTRGTSYDRYLLPLMFVLVVVALRMYEQRVGGRVSVICCVPLALLAAFAIAGTHDSFALSRARLDAANALRARGIPRSEFLAGYEYDGWTQVDLTGYVNEQRIHVPAGAYHPWQPPAGTPEGCIPLFGSFLPSIHPRYFLTTVRGLCYPDAQLPPVTYSSWLPRADHTIYTVRKP